jgi:hypothetical protein
MKWILVAGLLGIAVSGQALADSCWIVTGLSGKTAFSSDGYRITDDGISKAVFVIRIGEKTSDIQVAGGNASYGPGQALMVNDSMIVYIDPRPSATTEVWSIDPSKGVAYMTQSRAGFGEFNKAALFIGTARPGC